MIGPRGLKSTEIKSPFTICGIATTALKTITAIAGATRRFTYLHSFAVRTSFTTWGVPLHRPPNHQLRFGDKDHIPFWIEVRYKVGQSYSALLGFFRRFELIFTTAEERDVIRLHTNFQQGRGSVYVSPEHHRQGAGTEHILLYADYENKLGASNQSGTTTTRNCTTTLDRQMAAGVSQSSAIGVPTASERHVGCFAVPTEPAGDGWPAVAGVEAASAHRHQRARQPQSP